MFRFEYSLHLYAFLLIPILLLVFGFMWMQRKKALQNFGNNNLIQQLMPEASRYKHTLKFVLLIVAIALLIIGWANPQWGSKKEKVKVKSSDVIIALDLSNSMLAQDMKPNRLETARKFTLQLIDGLQGERIGLIIFAGSAYLQMPLTADYSAAKLFVKSASPSLIPIQGTAINEAIDLAERSFQEDSRNRKALILITDGENHEEGMMERAKTANDNGLLIFTVGVGTEQGASIPIYANGRSTFKTDESGKTVYSHLDETMLQELAQAGRGQYYNITANEKIITAVRDRIDQLEKQEMEQQSFSEYESYFQLFIGLALLLLIIEFIMSYRRSKWLEGKDLFS